MMETENRNETNKKKSHTQKAQITEKSRSGKSQKKRKI